MDERGQVECRMSLVEDVLVQDGIEEGVVGRKVWVLAQYETVAVECRRVLAHCAAEEEECRRVSGVLALYKNGQVVYMTILE